MKYLIAGILAVTLVWSCGEEETPKDILPEAKFVKIYADIMVADGVIDIEMRKDNESLEKGQSYYKEIFEKHGVTFEQFDKSLTYYMDDPKRMGAVLGKVLQELKKKEDTLAPDMSKPVTKDLIEMQKMILILLDIPNVKTLFERVVTTAQQMTADELKQWTIVFQKHNITRDQFTASFAHYAANEAQFKVIYDEVLRQLDELEETVSDSLNTVPDTLKK